MLLDLFIADGGDAAWLLAGLTVAELNISPLLLLFKVLLRASGSLYRRRVWLAVGLGLYTVLVSRL